MASCLIFIIVYVYLLTFPIPTLERISNSRENHRLVNGRQNYPWFRNALPSSGRNEPVTPECFNCNNDCPINYIYDRISRRCLNRAFPSGNNYRRKAVNFDLPVSAVTVRPLPIFPRWYEADEIHDKKRKRSVKKRHIDFDWLKSAVTVNPLPIFPRLCESHEMHDIQRKRCVKIRRINISDYL